LPPGRGVSGSPLLRCAAGRKPDRSPDETALQPSTRKRRKPELILRCGNSCALLQIAAQLLLHHQSGSINIRFHGKQ
jgi:hypothetical protein